MERKNHLIQKKHLPTKDKGDTILENKPETEKRTTSGKHKETRVKKQCNETNAPRKKTHAKKRKSKVHKDEERHKAEKTQIRKDVHTAKEKRRNDMESENKIGKIVDDHHKEGANVSLEVEEYISFYELVQKEVTICYRKEKERGRKEEKKRRMDAIRRKESEERHRIADKHQREERRRLDRKMHGEENEYCKIEKKRRGKPKQHSAILRANKLLNKDDENHSHIKVLSEELTHHSDEEQDKKREGGKEDINPKLEDESRRTGEERNVLQEAHRIQLESERSTIAEKEIQTRPQNENTFKETNERRTKEKHHKVNSSEDEEKQYREEEHREEIMKSKILAYRWPRRSREDEQFKQYLEHLDLLQTYIHTWWNYTLGPREREWTWPEEKAWRSKRRTDDKPYTDNAERKRGTRFVSQSDEYVNDVVHHSNAHPHAMLPPVCVNQFVSQSTKDADAESIADIAPTSDEQVKFPACISKSPSLADQPSNFG